MQDSGIIMDSSSKLVTTNVLRMKRVMQKTSLGRSTVYGKMSLTSSQYDPDFPRPIKLGGGAVGWLESEIEAWISLKTQARDYLWREVK